jgi:hypothetical protein
MIRNKIQGRCRQIIENLRLSGYAFDAAIVNNERQLKISNLLENDSLIAQSFSPKLMGGSKIRMDFHTHSIFLYLINENGDVDFLTKIENVYDLGVEEQIYKISTVYKKFFYSKDFITIIVESLLLDDKKSKKMYLTLSKINKTIPLRFYEVEDGCVNFYFGASIFSMKVVYYMSNNVFKVILNLYKKHSKTYKELNPFSENEYSIKSKYYYLIRKLLNIKYLNYENINYFISAYINFKTEIKK